MDGFTSCGVIALCQADRLDCSRYALNGCTLQLNRLPKHARTPQTAQCRPSNSFLTVGVATHRAQCLQDARSLPTLCPQHPQRA